MPDSTPKPQAKPITPAAPAPAFGPSPTRSGPEGKTWIQKLVRGWNTATLRRPNSLGIPAGPGQHAIITSLLGAGAGAGLGYFTGPRDKEARRKRMILMGLLGGGAGLASQYPALRAASDLGTTWSPFPYGASQEVSTSQPVHGMTA